MHLQSLIIINFGFERVYFVVTKICLSRIIGVRERNAKQKISNQLLQSDGSDPYNYFLIKMQLLRAVSSEDFGSKDLCGNFYSDITLRDFFCNIWSFLTELAFCAQTREASINGIQIFHSRLTSEFFLSKTYLNFENWLYLVL